MQSGPSRELLELWAPDSRNGLIITGYSIEGTPARVSIHSGIWLPTTVQSLYILRTMEFFCFLAPSHGCQIVITVLPKDHPSESQLRTNIELTVFPSDFIRT